jgi:hypothetical protein
VSCKNTIIIKPILVSANIKELNADQETLTKARDILMENAGINIAVEAIECHWLFFQALLLYFLYSLTISFLHRKLFLSKILL